MRQRFPPLEGSPENYILHASRLRVPHLISFVLDELLETVNNVQVSIIVKVNKVSCVQPTIFINCLRCGLRVAKILCSANNENLNFSSSLPHGSKNSLNILHFNLSRFLALIPEPFELKETDGVLWFLY